MTSMQDLFDKPAPSDVEKYIVVCKAGYEGERDLETFDNYWKAIAWIGHNYSDEEIEADNIDIATILVTGERIYEN